MNNKKNIEKSLRWDCRYYNGEKLNPYEEELKKHRVDNSHLSPPDCMHDEYDIPSDEVEKLQIAATCFNYERGWVNRKLKNDYEFHVDVDYLMDIKGTGDRSLYHGDGQVHTPVPLSFPSHRQR